MSMAMYYWQKFSDRLFSKKLASLSLLFVLGPLFLIFSSVTILIQKTPFHGLLLFLACLTTFVFFLAPRKQSLFTFIGVIAFFIYCYFSHKEPLSSRDLSWMATLILGLLISYLTIALGKETGIKEDAEKEEATKEMHLWKHRFEILSEKVEAEKKEIAHEVEKAKEASSQESSAMKSMRTLMAAMHKESQKAALQLLELEKENRRLQHKEETPVYKQDETLLEELKIAKEDCERMKLLLQDANEQLGRQEEAAFVRGERNKKLLATSTKKPISLSEIAKSVNKKTKASSLNLNSNSVDDIS